MKKQRLTWPLLFLFLFCAVMDSHALILPPVPTLTSVVAPTASGWDKIKAVYWAVADVVCLTGQYQANKYFPINLRYRGQLSVMGVKITDGCTPFDYYVYTNYAGYGDWQNQRWGYGQKYINAAYRQATTSGVNPYTPSNTFLQQTIDMPYHLGGSWNTGSVSGPAFRITGRNYNREACYSGCSTACGGPGACEIYTWATLYDSTGSLVTVANLEFSGSAIYLPNQGPVNTSAIAGGHFESLGAVGGSTWPVAGGTINDINTYNDYIAQGAVDLTDTDVSVSSAGVDISTQIVNFYITIASGSIDLSRVESKLNAISTTTTGILDALNVQFSSSSSGILGILNRINDKIPSVSLSDITSATTTHWADYTAFTNLYSSVPVQLLGQFIPISTQSWRPCFDMSFVFSGLWSTAPQAVGLHEFCLTDFNPAWDIFKGFVICFFSIWFACWGVWGLWQTLQDIRIPGIFGQLGSVLGWVSIAVLATAEVALTFWVYKFISDTFLYGSAILLNCVGQCSGFNLADNPGIIVELMNYLGISQGLSIFLSLVVLRWQLLLFLNFFGFIKK